MLRNLSIPKSAKLEFQEQFLHDLNLLRQLNAEILGGPLMSSQTVRGLHQLLSHAATANPNELLELPGRTEVVLTPGAVRLAALLIVGHIPAQTGPSGCCVFFHSCGGESISILDKFRSFVAPPTALASIRRRSSWPTSVIIRSCRSLGTIIQSTGVT